MNISDFVNLNLISFLEVYNRDEALAMLVDLLVKEGKVQDGRGFLEAILVREKIVSTGIGMGVAIPHAKLKNFPEFFIAIGIQKKKGLEWDALDKAPVKLIFMIGGPDGRQTDYLKILSRLTLAIKNEELRKNLLRSESKEKVVQLLKDF